MSLFKNFINLGNFFYEVFATTSSVTLYVTIKVTTCLGPFMCYVTPMGVGGGKIFRKKRYEGVMFNVISVTRGWVGVQFPKK